MLAFGEDWAEGFVHKIGIALNVLTAEVRPATLADRRGTISRSVVDSVAVERLVHGNNLLAEIDPGYDATLKRENPRYTVGAITKTRE